jgi:hypothetical protein
MRGSKYPGSGGGVGNHTYSGHSPTFNSNPLHLFRRLYGYLWGGTGNAFAIIGLAKYLDVRELIWYLNGDTNMGRLRSVLQQKPDIPRYVLAWAAVGVEFSDRFTIDSDQKIARGRAGSRIN